MAARPYREPASIAPDPPPDPKAALARLGGKRSVHVPPPLHRALLGPVLITAIITVVGLVAEGPPAVVLPCAAASFAILAWSPLRLGGFSAAVHERGLVLSRGRVRSVVPFEDVDEVWFEVAVLHSQSGAYLRALRLREFGGAVHRVPLAVEGGDTLAEAILSACSGPLLAEAKQALREGATLTFGPIQLDRQGISVGGARATWAEIRQASVSHAKLLLYRRWPLVSWRTVSLDRIPNPAVFVGLVMASAAKVQIDDVLLLPFAPEAPAKAWTAAERRAHALKAMLFGGVVFLIGAAITANSEGRVIAYGAMIVGGWRFFRALVAYLGGAKR